MVQKYSMKSSCFPLCFFGKNSAKISKGTVKPPTPKPTANRIPSNEAYPVAKAVNTPNKLIMTVLNKYAGRLP